MNEHDKHIVEILQNLKREFGQNRNYSTVYIHGVIDRAIRKM